MTTYSLVEAHDAEAQAKVDQIIGDKNTKFALHYFAVHARVAPIRCQLMFADADWEDVFVPWDTFAEVKAKQPFGTLPVLHETNANGDTLIIPESGCIERYLAHKFDQMGSNQCQALQVDTILSLTQSVMEFYWYSVVVLNDDELKAKNKNELYEKRLPKWLTHLEQLAVRNGSNGHLVGDKFTLADAKFVAQLDSFLAVDTEAFLTPKAYPALFKVKETIDTHPRFSVYRKSEDYAKMSTNIQGFFLSNKVPFDYSKSNLY